MNQFLLEISIPTYNRCDALINNLIGITNIIKKNALEEDIKITISDNNSPDDTYRTVQTFIDNVDVHINIYRQDENIGGVNNLLFLIGKADAKYIMLLGDDDVFSEKYLLKSINYLKSNKIKTILPNCYNTLTYYYRDPIGKDIVYNNEESRFKLMLKASQLSGLVFTTAGLYEEIKAKKIRNMYPQIFMIGYSLKNQGSVHIRDCPIKVEMGNKKYWDYGKNGLLDNYFENIVKSDISRIIKLKLQLRYFLLVGDFNIKHLIKSNKSIFKAIYSFFKIENVLLESKILYPVCVFLYYIKKGYRHYFFKVIKNTKWIQKYKYINN